MRQSEAVCSTLQSLQTEWACHLISHAVFIVTKIEAWEQVQVILLVYEGLKLTKSKVYEETNKMEREKNGNSH